MVYFLHHATPMETPMPQSTTHAQAPEQPKSSNNQPHKPIDKFIDGPVHVSIWENAGTKGAFRSASFEIRYKDAQENWQTGRSYTASNLKHLESAAREARARIEVWQQASAEKLAPRP
jgi:hypothetical protein